ncbi:hypothetical protein K431DRAFT_290738 [Polychaeton citri CBS 116435]|uniref:Uncharacterized protein n=1 Tax=Polychaeton citri CBS 116435 TaxID=1314669 RepID=A0A9P4QIR5_9PEZI|nr:hypothetical protein K431DRAFT_290738 [Polychaeton citri CBS 116435]
MPSSRTPTNELKKLALSGKDDMPVQTRAMTHAAASSSSSRSVASSSHRPRPANQATRPARQARPTANVESDDDSDDSDDDDDDDDGDDRPAGDARAIAFTRVRKVIQALSIFDPAGYSPFELQGIIERREAASRDTAGRLYTNFTTVLAQKAATDTPFYDSILQQVKISSDPWCQVLTEKLAKRVNTSFAAFDSNTHNTDFVVNTSRSLWAVNNALGMIIRNYRDISSDSRKKFLALLTDMLDGLIPRDHPPPQLRVTYVGELDEHVNLYTNLLRNTRTGSLDDLFVVGTLNDLSDQDLLLIKNELGNVYRKLYAKEYSAETQTWRENAPQYFMMGIGRVLRRGRKNIALQSSDNAC